MNFSDAAASRFSAMAFSPLPEEQMFYCGMAMSCADMEHAIKQWPTRKAELDELACLKGFSADSKEVTR